MISAINIMIFSSLNQVEWSGWRRGSSEEESTHRVEQLETSVGVLCDRRIVAVRPAIMFGWETMELSKR